MKAYKMILAALAALIMCFSLPLTAFAADAAPAPQPGAEISFEGKSWDDVVDELLEQFGTTRYSISAAYLNLVTGEEYYVNPDNYSRAASMYKLPLNMYYYEQELEGIIAPESLHRRDGASALAGPLHGKQHGGKAGCSRAQIGPGRRLHGQPLQHGHAQVGRHGDDGSHGDPGGKAADG